MFIFCTTSLKPHFEIFSFSMWASHPNVQGLYDNFLRPLIWGPRPVSLFFDMGPFWECSVLHVSAPHRECLIPYVGLTSRIFGIVVWGPREEYSSPICEPHLEVVVHRCGTHVEMLKIYMWAPPLDLLFVEIWPTLRHSIFICRSHIDTVIFICGSHVNVFTFHMWALRAFNLSRYKSMQGHFRMI